MLFLINDLSHSVYYEYDQSRRMTSIKDALNQETQLQFITAALIFALAGCRRKLKF